MAPAADRASPVGGVDAVWVPDQPVVVLGEVGAGSIRTRGAVHIVEHRCLPVHVQLVEPRAGLPKKTPGSNLNRNQESEAGPEGGGWGVVAIGRPGEVPDFC